MNRLRELRDEAGLTLRQEERMTGIDHSVLSLLEKGTRPFRSTHIEALTNFYDVTSDYLLGYSDFGLKVEFMGTPGSEKDDEDYITGEEYNKIRADTKVEVSICKGSKDFMLRADLPNQVIETYGGPFVMRYVKATRTQLTKYLGKSTRKQIMKLVSQLDDEQAGKVLALIKIYLEK